MNKWRSLILLVVVELLIINDVISSQVFEFLDDFESYIPGQQLACQDSVNWTTFFGNPCDPVEDPIISTDYSITGTKSLKIVENNDLIKSFGSHTSGFYYVTFWLYIPTGKAGYFSTLAVFDGFNSNWGMECYFDAGGTGRIFGGSIIPVTFTWASNDWQFVTVVVSLMSDYARFYIDNTLIHEWQWTDGVYGSGSPLSIEATNFYGITTNDLMYIENYVFNEPPLTPPPLYAPTNLVVEDIYNPYPQVKLIWQDNSNYEYAFNIIRKDGPLFGPGSFEPIGTAPQNATVYIDSTVVFDSTYTYGVFAYNVYGFSDTSNFATIILHPVNVTSGREPLNSFYLGSNYPNPFNPSTKIKFTVPQSPLLGGDGRGGLVMLKVYDVLGNEIATLVNEELAAGEYEVEFSAKGGSASGGNATSLPSGIYFYKLQSGKFSETKKMILIK